MATGGGAIMIAPWLTWLSIVSLVVAAVTAVVIALDLRRHPQSMAVMNPVWPITALYFGPLALWAYWTMGRQASPAMSGHDHAHHHEHKEAKPFWMQTFVGSTHCGAGCTLGDIFAEFLVFFAGITIAGSTFGAQLVLDYAFAFLLGVGFQYASIVPMRGLKPVAGVIAAFKADALSLTAFEIGLFGWMAVMQFGFFTTPPKPDTPVFWFMMQIGMIIGFATAYPMNWVLVKTGIKDAM